MMRSLAVCILTLNVLLLLGGCGGKQYSYEPDVLRGETYTINPPQAVLDSADMAGSAVNSSESWWMNRNDQRVSRRDGAAYREPGEAFVRTYDRQQSSGNNIHDNYHRVGYGYEYRSVNP